jgi:crotonobetainyl-CoA:carnitine CoA-transferase CaiB-like acyl-CoA transferase
MGVLAALFHRQQTGEGQKLEIVMLEAALDLQMEPLVYYLNGGLIERPREALASSFHEAPYGVYETRDGYLALSLSPIKAIRQALGGPVELAPYEDPALALSGREEIYRVLASLLRARSTEGLLSALREHGVWCAPVNDYEQMLQDPAVRHLSPVLEIEHPEAGRVRLLKHPVRYSAGEPEIRGLPPSLGEHTDVVLAELGYSANEIDSLRGAGAI